MSYRAIILFGLLLFSFSGFTQTMSGLVYDSVSDKPLIGVSIIQMDADSNVIHGTVSGIDGAYRFELKEVDNFTVHFSYIGFRPVQFSQREIQLKSGYDIQMVFDRTLLDCELEIVGYPYHYFSTSKIGELSIDGNHPGFAASFNDPSRSLIRYPSMGVSNDQANAITFRGLPSEFTAWRMDGAEIVNPNHLSNAGTLSDKSAANAGGVMAIPFEVLEKYKFYPSPYDNEFENAIAGISDLIPVQNPQAKPSFLKIGFLGAEAGLHHRFNTGKNVGLHNVSAHYRYSFTGLLDDLGADLGDEEIRYQDAFLRMKLFEKNRAGIYLTGIYGKSSNDSEIASFASDILITGINYVDYHINGQQKMLASFYYSASETERFGIKERIESPIGPLVTKFENNLNDYQKYSLHFSHRLFTGSEELFRYGLNLSNSDNFTDWLVTDNSFTPGITRTLISGTSPKWNGNLFFSKAFEVGPVYFEPQVSLAYTSNENYIPEGRVAIQFTKLAHNIELVISKSHQLPTTQNYALSLIPSESSIFHPLKSIKSYNAELSYQFSPYERNTGEKYKIGIFYHDLYDVPISIPRILLPELLYDPFTGVDFLEPNYIVSEGTARTYGVEIMTHHEISSHFHLNANASFFDSKYSRLGTGNEFNSPYNYGYTFNTVLTRRQFFGSKQLYLSLASHLRGAAYLPEIDETRTYEELRSVYTRNFVQQERPYWRIDFRSRYEFGKNQLILDIQNVLNRQNDGFLYYDPLTGTIEEKKQLGLIPVLSYKRIF